MDKTRMIKIITILFVCFLSGSVVAQNVDTYLAKGDSADAKFDNQTALDNYKKVLELEPKNYEALWKISRAYVNIGEHLPKEQQLAYFEMALDYADSAVTADPSQSDGYTARAIARGRISLFKGVWSSIGLVKDIRKDLQIALKINPHDTSALYVYARAHQKVAEKSKLFRIPVGLGWGSKKEAKKLYEKAIALKPNFIMYNLDYARLLVDMKKYDQAKEVLEKIPDMPIQDEDDPRFKEEAQQLLSEIQDK